MEMSTKQIEALVAEVMNKMGNKESFSGGGQPSNSSANLKFNESFGEGGCEPFDKEYGMMDFGDPTKVNPSPYDRINRILHRVHAIEESVDDERAMLYTEAHQKFGGNGGRQILTNAKILAYLLENLTINIYPDELIVGEMAAPARHSPIYPEFSYDWIVRELKDNSWSNRESDVFAVSDEVKQNLLSIADYWEGKNIKDHLIANYLTEEEIKGTSLEDGRPVFMPNLYVYGGVGHTCVDYENVLTKGFSGLKKRIVEKLEEVGDFSTPEGLEKREFYTAGLICLEASSKFIRRYAKLAKEKAAKESNPEEKRILEQIAANCEWISENPPRGYWEALQLYHFVSNITLIESNGHSITYAAFDTVLYPFYEKDMKEGKIEKSFVSQLMESFYVKIFELRKVRDNDTAKVNSEVGIGGACLVVGGQDKEGNDVTNDLTYLAIEAHNHTRLPDPWFAVRWNDAAPYELKVKIIEAIKIGTGQPKLFNDLGIVPAAMAKGVSLEDARTCTLVGCVEIDVPGKEYGAHDASYFNLAKVFELAINGGRCIDCGSGCPRWEKCGAKGHYLGLNTGSLKSFKSMDEIKEAYRKQMKYWVDRLVGLLNATEKAHAVMKPLPTLSAMNCHAVEKGLDLTEGGAKYNFTGPQGCGPATVADSMSAIQKLVFDEKRITGEELLECLSKNWEGYDDLLHLVNSDYIPHFGNDIDEVDELAVFASDVYFDEVSGRPNARGGIFVPGLYSVSANVGLGLAQGATADGRTAGEAVSNCIGPVNTHLGCHDYNGPTAMANSAAKYDHQRAGNGTLLNIRFTPNSVAGKQGTSNMINFVEAYFSKKPQHIQFNIQNTETLRDAQKNPENYKGLLVRVAGYSAYFTRMSKALQDDLINRNAYDEI